MKWFYASCGAFVVGILLVGSVDARPPHSGHRSGHRVRHKPAHPRRVVMPWRPQLPWQALPQQTQDPAIDIPDIGGDDPIVVDDQPGVDVIGGNGALPQAMPRGAGPRQMPGGGKRTPQTPGRAKPRR
jgi:hypothetical protein